jgi:predicted transcriptional regulator
MTLAEIIELLEGEILVGIDALALEIRDVVASDGMSEILAFARAKELMVTGLTNIQSIRTADIAGVSAVLYCRGKVPDKRVLDFARDKRIPVLITTKGMFEVCGLLYSRGLRGVS